MTICFEGPSAVGKTTLSQSFSSEYLVIPEVNVLFQEEKREGRLWYYQKQLQRHQRARQAKQTAILDGDVFQPLWYNWIYGYPPAFPSFAETIAFYYEQIHAGTLDFPDLYVIFAADPASLKQRKEQDTRRKRRNFEKHLRLIEPQRRYFEFIHDHTQIPVAFVQNRDLAQTRQTILDLIHSLKDPSSDAVQNFAAISDWLAQNEPLKTPSS